MYVAETANGKIVLGNVTITLQQYRDLIEPLAPISTRFKGEGLGIVTATFDIERSRIDAAINLVKEQVPETDPYFEEVIGFLEDRK